MTQHTVPTELKQRQRAMWASGDYPAVADTLIPGLGQTLVDACGITSGQRVLDVAAGTGNASIPAARIGADVVASDLTPELLAAGRRAAESEGLTLEWREADAEALPFADGSFDVVLSSVGVMFAPFHQAAADELVRVARSGGTIGLASWTPEGFIGQLFAAMGPYSPPPPPGAQPPPLWGNEEHLAELFGDRVRGATAERRHVIVDAFDSPEGYRDFFKENYGPAIAVYKSLADDAARVASLDSALADLGRRHYRADGTSRWEYLLYTVTRS
ncbi:class I SAM-dependent methyltransferase [Tomitella biformata]|uniref:class I SAM-dependent methyltransferase n=1 Tax=Tomitella biformata TaxID=630403 RepID=UPI000466D93D|nr:class I SAM-dependent methyltransferase [Tomitella biformata]